MNDHAGVTVGGTPLEDLELADGEYDIGVTDDRQRCYLAIKRPAEVAIIIVLTEEHVKKVARVLPASWHWFDDSWGRAA